MLTTIILYTAAGLFILFSAVKSKTRTIQGFKSAGYMAKGMAKDIFAILAIIGLLLASLPGELISSVLGNTSSFLSTLAGAAIGTVTIIPGVIAFPMAGELLAKGASPVALAAFITTLTMVGLATLPVEMKYFGKKFSYLRNILSFIFAIITALIMGVLL